jgi:SAM-dependent methyltransferase
MSLSDFPWPLVGAERQIPIWSGTEFQLGARRLRVVDYDRNDSHWSESLTTMHEELSGSGHPIDLASRQLAVATMKRLRGRPGLRIMDVGCSSGFALEDLQRAIPEADLIGADYLSGPLEKLAERIKGVPLLQFDLRNCPLPDASLDGITCLNVLEHIDDHERALGHLFRILKPGGLAHIEVPAGSDLYDAYDEILMHHRRYDLRELKRLARAAGFQVDTATHLGCLAYPGFWWVKKRNRRTPLASAAEKNRLVVKRIAWTRHSFLISAVFRLEAALSRWIVLPWGIRVVAVVRKPDPTAAS